MSVDEIARILVESGIPICPLFEARYVAIAAEKRGWVGGTLRRFVFEPETIVILVRAVSEELGISHYALMRRAKLHPMTFLKWDHSICRPKFDSIEQLNDAITTLREEKSRPEGEVTP